MRTSSADPSSLAALLLPGILVAATGVGAGDLVTASLPARKLWRGQSFRDYILPSKA